jgi:hypothetical protein
MAGAHALACAALLQVTIVGSGFTETADKFAITFGNTSCGGVEVLNASALQCTTQKLADGTVPQGPLDVQVGLQQGLACDAVWRSKRSASQDASLADTLVPLGFFTSGPDGAGRLRRACHNRRRADLRVCQPLVCSHHLVRQRGC